MSKTEDKPEMRVLKMSTCKSVTGKSTLTYQIGASPNNAAHIRITKNTGAGFFNDEWIALKDIEKALAEGPEGQPLTSFLLQPLFRGKSVNSPAFMLAALTKERLLRVMKGKKRGHEFLDPEGFNNKMDRLVASKAKSRTSTKASTKTAIKKRSMSRQKKATAN